MFMWLKNKTPEAVSRQLQRVYQERGPPAEMLTDNGLCFISSKLKAMLA